MSRDVGERGSAHILHGIRKCFQEDRVIRILYGDESESEGEVDYKVMQYCAANDHGNRQDRKRDGHAISRFHAHEGSQQKMK